MNDVVGVKELQKKLAGLDTKLSHKVLAQSVRAAMVPLRNEAIQNAPRGDDAHRTHKGRLVPPGYLKQNIKLKKMRIRDKRIAGYTLAARGEAWYGKLYETGWTARGPKKKGKLSFRKGKATKVPGKPWLGKALKSRGDQVQANLIKELNKRIKKALK